MDGQGRLDRQTASWPTGYLKVPAEHDTNKKFLFCFSAEEQEEETDDEDDNGSDDLDEDDNLMSPASLIHLEDSVGPGNVYFPLEIGIFTCNRVYEPQRLPKKICLFTIQRNNST